MDPASIVGLVAACSSLAKVCGTVVTTLHSLVETYRNAELAILSITEECETVRFAWTRIEEWAARNLHTMEDAHMLGERLQRSVYSGELIMSALHQDLTNAIPKTGNFRRRTSLAWNDALFREHQTRIRGQVTALQLLLQVINMPRNEDRLEVLTIKEKVFRDVEESAKSIIPSHLSSRMSRSDSVATSTRTRQSVDLQYVPYEFDNDLFTSYVYKRNYRLPFMTRIFSSRRSIHSRTDRSVQQKGGNPVPSIDPRARSRPASTVSEVPAEAAAVDQEAEPEQPTEPAEVVMHKRGDSFQSYFTANSSELFTYLNLKQLSLGPRRAQSDPHHVLMEMEEILGHLQTRNFKSAIEKVQNGFDIAILFRPDQEKWLPLTLQFLRYVLLEEPCLFVILTERLTYLAGTRWIRMFMNLFNSVGDVARFWAGAEAAAKAFDAALARVDYVWTDLPTAVQLAYSESNFGAASYLLNVGRRSSPVRDPDHPITLDTPIANKANKILAQWLKVPPDVLAVALWQPISNEEYKEFVKWNSSALSLIRNYCADVNSMVQYREMRLPLIHAILYLIHDEAVEPGMSVAIFEFLASKCVRPDRCGDVRWCPDRSISTLALAAVLGNPLLMGILVKMGARMFWANDIRVFDEASKYSYDTSLTSILKALKWPTNQQRIRGDAELMTRIKRLARAYGKGPDYLADPAIPPERQRIKIPNSPVFSPQSDEIRDSNHTFDRTVIERIRTVMSVPDFSVLEALDAMTHPAPSPPPLSLLEGDVLFEEESPGLSPIPREYWTPGPKRWDAMVELGADEARRRIDGYMTDVP